MKQRILLFFHQLYQWALSPGEIVDVSSRRFDTDAVLQHVIEGDKGAFEAFYERYRGRIYRFIARQFGTGDFGKAAYYSVWRHLVIASRTTTSPKALKLSFFRNLGKPSQVAVQQKQTDAHANYLPRDIEEDGKWSLVFIDHFRRLPEPMKKRFLFKHEIGLSVTAIARIFEDKRKHVEKSIDEAERILRLNMEDAGCPSSLSLDKLYRDSRVVKPPESWNGEILDSFHIWLKQVGSEDLEIDSTESQTSEVPVSLGDRVNEWMLKLKQFKSKHKRKTEAKAGKAN
jgi:DNA-directed RNA polymerase specialized sigma24 family protein